MTTKEVEMEEYQQADPQERLRLLEYRYGLMRDRLLMVNQSFLTGHRNTMSELRALDAEIKELRKETFEIKEIISHAVRELQECAKKENLKVLEKYINVWNPLNFVTEKEVISLIDAHLKEKEEKQD